MGCPTSQIPAFRKKALPIKQGSASFTHIEHNITNKTADTLRRQPLSRFTVSGLINKYAREAGLAELAVHPHMLRQACGYSLANKGTDTRLIQDYLGHKNILHTVRYTKLAPNRFANLW
jgi:site-specific recombinase XerD